VLLNSVRLHISKIEKFKVHIKCYFDGVLSKEHTDELIFLLVVWEHFTACEASIKLILCTIE
jgi:hypothetical protein